MNANTVYDIFLTLPEQEKQSHVDLVNGYNTKKESNYCIPTKTKKKNFTYIEQDANDYVLKHVFTSKDKINKTFS